jgi:hypothetical protein
MQQMQQRASVLGAAESKPNATYGSAISKTLRSCVSVIKTLHARHSNACNSASSPIFAVERTNRMAAPQLGHNGAG